jgi:D-alanyl-D-alanine dipeptidase
MFALRLVHDGRMRLSIAAFLVAVVPLSPALAKKAPKGPPPPPSPILEVRQLVLVTSADWDAPTGKLQRYQRSKAGGGWAKVGKQIPVAVGKAGMAWGIGLHGAAPAPPVKHEGDNKAPAGAFGLSAAFGYQPKGPKVKLPYVELIQSMECVDDAASTHYNRILDKKMIKQIDWTSAEHMNRADDLYRFGVVVDHNGGSPVASAGSCIFLHIRARDGSSTAGCTSMDAKEMEDLQGWLDPTLKPALVQMPESEAKRLKKGWGLP